MGKKVIRKGIVKGVGVQVAGKESIMHIEFTNGIRVNLPHNNEVTIEYEEETTLTPKKKKEKKK